MIAPGRGHSKRYGLWPPPRQRPEPDGVVFPRVQTSQCTEAGERVAATLVNPSCGQSTLLRSAIVSPSQGLRTESGFLRRQ